MFCAVRSSEEKPVLLSTSRAVGEAVSSRIVAMNDVVHPDDKNAFFHLAIDKEAVSCVNRIRSLPYRLADLSIQVSTGPVVDFRVRECLRQEPDEQCAPLIYPTHLRGGRVEWPQVGGRKPNGLIVNEATEKLLYPRGTYVAVKRFSSKEERRRIVATVVGAATFDTAMVAFENHLNIFHQDRASLPEGLAHGLAAYLNTTAVDVFFRQFNGHTQVNATDLRSLRFPSSDDLLRLGEAVCGIIAQADLDRAAERTIPTLAP